MKVRINFGALKKVKDKITQTFGGHGDRVDADELMSDIIRVAGNRCLAKTIKRTPVDTGNLRQNWELGDVTKRGFNYTVEMENPVEYASYVEFGHRQEVGRYVPAIDKRLVAPWVEGKYMATKSVDEVKEELPKIAEEKINKKLAEIFK